MTVKPTLTAHGEAVPPPGGASPPQPLTERAPDQLAKSMPNWLHTHDLVFRQRTWPVMSKVWMGMQLMFRADGMVEWIRHPVGGWAMRGVWCHGVALRSLAYERGVAHNPEFLPPAVDELRVASELGKGVQ